MLKYFHGALMKIYLHEHLTHEYFYTRKLPDLRYFKKINFSSFFVTKFEKSHLLHLIIKFRNTDFNYLNYCNLRREADTAWNLPQFYSYL